MIDKQHFDHVSFCQVVENRSNGGIRQQRVAWNEYYQLPNNLQLRNTDNNNTGEVHKRSEALLGKPI